MGTLSDFFAAPDGSAPAEVVDVGPAGRLPSVRTTDVDQVKLATLLGIVSGRDPGDEDAFLECLDEVEDGLMAAADDLFVYRVPARVAAALVGASSSDVDRIASAWAATDEWRAERAEPASVRAMVADLRDLGRRALAQGDGLFVWLSA